MYRFTLARRIVAVIALGLLIVVVANFITSEGWQVGSAQNGLFPSSVNGAQIGQATLYAFGGGLSGWVVLLVWVVAIGIWATGSLFLLNRPSPISHEEPDETRA